MFDVLIVFCDLKLGFVHSRAFAGGALLHVLQFVYKLASLEAPRILELNFAL